MAKSPNQKLKLLYLYQILLQRTDEEHPITVPQLIGELDLRGIRAERKSVYDDLEALADPKHPDYPLFQHLAYDQDKLDRLWEDQTMLRTPIVRNGRQATVGYCPEVWAAWE